MLVAAGILEIAGEQRIRGAVERRYQLRQDQASVSPGTFESASREDHRRAFAAAMAALLAEFDAYLDQPDADPAADQVGYLQRAIWLTHDELLGMITGLRSAIAPVLDNPATPDRTRYLISPILFPTEKFLAFLCWRAAPSVLSPPMGGHDALACARRSGMNITLAMGHQPRKLAMVAYAAAIARPS